MDVISWCGSFEIIDLQDHFYLLQDAMTMGCIVAFLFFTLFSPHFLQVTAQVHTVLSWFYCLTFLLFVP